MHQFRSHLACFAPALLMLLVSGQGHAETRQLPMLVVAAITPGCRLGSAQTDVGSFGDIDLGSVANMEKPIQRASSAGAGSIVMNCTPGTNYQISINDGLSPSGVAGQRRLRSVAPGEAAFLTYQLYQDVAYSRIWGEGAQARSGTAKGGVEEFPVYINVAAKADARPGAYSDTVIVTVSY